MLADLQRRQGDAGEEEHAARFYVNLQDSELVRGGGSDEPPSGERERLLRGPLAGQLSRDFALPNFGIAAMDRHGPQHYSPWQSQ